jgi:hypothetical protein
VLQRICRTDSKIAALLTAQLIRAGSRIGRAEFAERFERQSYRSAPAMSLRCDVQ